MEIKDHIIAATVDVFETMVMMDADPGAPLAEKVTSFTCTVSGTLGFSGDLKGMLSIHCPYELAKAITGNMLGMEVEEIDEDVKDTIGEIANMVTGGIKTTLAEEGKDLELSIPTVLGGKSYTVSKLAEADWLVVPFKIAGDRLLVEFQFLPNPS